MLLLPRTTTLSNLVFILYLLFVTRAAGHSLDVIRSYDNVADTPDRNEIIDRVDRICNSADPPVNVMLDCINNWSDAYAQILKSNKDKHEIIMYANLNVQEDGRRVHFQPEFDHFPGAEKSLREDAYSQQEFLEKRNGEYQNIPDPYYMKDKILSLRKPLPKSKTRPTTPSPPKEGQQQPVSHPISRHPISHHPIGHRIKSSFRNVKQRVTRRFGSSTDRSSSRGGGGTQQHRSKSKVNQRMQSYIESNEGDYLKIVQVKRNESGDEEYGSVPDGELTVAITIPLLKGQGDLSRKNTPEKNALILSSGGFGPPVYRLMIGNKNLFPGYLIYKVDGYSEVEYLRPYFRNIYDYIVSSFLETEDENFRDLCSLKLLTLHTESLKRVEELHQTLLYHHCNADPGNVVFNESPMSHCKKLEKTREGKTKIIEMDGRCYVINSKNILFIRPYRMKKASESCWPYPIDTWTIIYDWSRLLQPARVLLYEDIGEKPGRGDSLHKRIFWEMDRLFHDVQHNWDGREEAEKLKTLIKGLEKIPTK